MEKQSLNAQNVLLCSSSVQLRFNMSIWSAVSVNKPTERWFFFIYRPDPGAALQTVNNGNDSQDAVTAAGDDFYQDMRTFSPSQLEVIRSNKISFGRRTWREEFLELRYSVANLISVQSVTSHITLIQILTLGFAAQGGGCYWYYCRRSLEWSVVLFIVSWCLQVWCEHVYSTSDFTQAAVRKRNEGL